MKKRKRERGRTEKGRGERRRMKERVEGGESARPKGARILPGLDMFIRGGEEGKRRGRDEEDERRG